MTREIPLTRGYVALVDDADYDFLVGIGSWYASPSKRTVYARHSTRRQGQVYSTGMHNVILGGVGIDHVNGNGLDNRRVNLRRATDGENNRNRRRRTDNTSGYKGVSLHTRIGRFQAYITSGGRRQHLGYFDDLIEAARAYDAAAIETFGEFARLNFPKEHIA